MQYGSSSLSLIAAPTPSLGRVIVFHRKPLLSVPMPFSSSEFRITWAYPRSRRYVILEVNCPNLVMSSAIHQTHTHSSFVWRSPLYSSLGNKYMAQCIGNEIHMQEEKTSTCYLFSDILSHCKSVWGGFHKCRQAVKQEEWRGLTISGNRGNKCKDIK